ncbi:MAG: ABC transporter ATP-binding protein [Chloroflexi bacterium]|nr:ABC transporter ATP-binding protein [Chloroflexota bacterium]
MNNLWRISKLAAQDKWRWIGAWVSLLLSTAFFLTVPKLIGNAIDTAVRPGGSRDELITIGLLIIGVIFLRGLFNFGNLYLAESLSQRVSYKMRNLVYDKLQHLSFAFHDHEHTGNLMSKSTVDVEMIRNFVQMGLVRSGQIFLLVAGVSVIMLATDWQLGLVALTFVPIVSLRAIIASTAMRKIWLQAQVEMGHMTTVLQENLEGQRVVKAFGAEEYEEAKFRKKNQDVFDWTLSARRAQAFNSSLMQIIFWGSTGIILWLGGRAVIEGRVSIGDFTAFLFYISLLVQPIRMVGMLVNNFARAISAAERVYDILDANSPVSEAEGVKPLENVKGHVRFNDVTFSYRSEPVVAEVTLDVPAGHVVALMGAPGSGKSTLVSLLARFYDPHEGTVTIDGVDVREASLASVRRAVGIVQQDVFLFSATVRDNIAYGNLDASMDQVIEAATTAQLHDEIMALPEGYETIVGERGMSLSGGQRQRLSIARTLILDPPILVLDDSTASVDAGTESRIQEAIGQVIRGRTTFIIAHRLSSIQHAQTVVVLDHGRIAEMGSPAELAASGGLFTYVSELQYATALNGIAATPRLSQPGGARA